MRPIAFLRTISVRFSSPPVAPWPVQSSFDRWLTAELDTLQCHSPQPQSYASAKWILHGLDVAVDTQNMTIESLGNVVCRVGDRKAIEDYLEDAVKLLDACNHLRERMEIVENYIEFLRIVLHYLEGRHELTKTALARARVVLDSCEATERRCTELEKCSSGLRKLGEKLAQSMVKAGSCEGTISGATELYQVLSGSKAIALLACGVLGIALSFKSKRGLPATQSRHTTSWSSSLHELHKEVKEEIEKHRKSGGPVLTELRQAVVAAQNLRELLNSRWPENKALQIELRLKVEDLGRRCGELEEGINPLKGRVNELCRHLISIRMALLGILSRA